MRDVIDPDDINIYRQLGGGLTTANVLHGSANPIGGQNAVIKLRWGKRPSDLLFKDAPEEIKFALGENVKQANCLFYFRLIHLYTIHLFKGVCGHKPDGIPGEFGADPGTDHTASTFVEPDLYRWNGKSIFFFGHWFNTIHRAERNTSLTACTVILIYHSHNFWTTFLNPGIIR